MRGKRTDGYHNIESLVVFSEFGDHLTFEAADRLSLQVTGRFSDQVPMDSSNLILEAAAVLDPQKGAKIRLQKEIPVMAGLGGGSADAAAALHALADLWGCALPAYEDAVALGADVPVCCVGQTARVEGIGESVRLQEGVPEFAVVLINPAVSLATRDVFNAVEEPVRPPLTEVPRNCGVREFAEWLRLQNNDLQDIAIKKHGVIAEVIYALNGSRNCLLARMSGSGPSCFGLFPNDHAAQSAVQELTRSHPTWWIQSSRTKVN